MPPAEPASMPEYAPAVATIVHAFLALWGLIDCFLGFRIFKATVRILMAFGFAAGGATLALQLYPDSVPALLGFAIGGLIVGMLLGWFVYQTGVFALGFSLGVMIAAPFASSIDPAYSDYIVVGAGLVLGVMALLLLRPVVMAATAITGGFRLVFGVAFFFGGPNLMLLLQTPEDYAHLVQANWLLGGIALLLGAIGFYVQSADTRKKKKDED